jgi:hypothetical protein
VSTTEKAGAVWWHLVQEQRSRAFEQLTLRKMGTDTKGTDRM